MAQVISVADLGFRHSAQDPWLFRNLNFTLRRGAVLTVVGRSGCGKSTLLRMLAGLRDPTEGLIRHETSSRINRLNSAIMFQDARLLPWRRAVDNVALGCECQSLTGPERRLRIAHAMNAVGIAELANRYPHQLSGGQQQRVALARALVSHAPLLLLDEPFSALDPQTHGEMIDLLRSIAEHERRAIVLVTHEIEDAARLSGPEFKGLENTGTVLELEQNQRDRTPLLLALP